MISFYLATNMGGLLLQAEQGQLQRVSHVSKPTASQLKANQHIPQSEEKRVLLNAAQQLEDYFSGSRTSFDLELNWQQGTAFQQKVWQALQAIPYGETISYKQLAESINNTKAVRAVGGANNKNPFSIIVPCHRVIGANGQLVGYAGGLQRKQYLLDLETSRRLVA